MRLPSIPPRSYTPTSPPVETVTDAFAGITQDVRLIDNGDGTFTRHVSNKGHHVLYSDDGVVLARSAGIFGYNVVYNYAGTPSDPSDDFKVGRPFNFKETGLKSTTAPSSSARSADQEGLSQKRCKTPHGPDRDWA